MTKKIQPRPLTSKKIAPDITTIPWEPHARHVKAAEEKTFSPALLHAVADYQNSSEGRQHSKYLDSLIRERSATR
jgi:hypothetical protein